MNAIKERPILFSAPMVRAILEGRKTVTRRPVKGLSTSFAVITAADESPLNSVCWNVGGPIIRCPYGKPGDRLWVRETTEVDEETSPVVRLARYAADHQPVRYRHPEGDEYDGTVAHWDYPRRSRPSIHMPRWASRILLEITDVRVERLHDISRADIRAEGMQCPPELASDDVSPNYRDWYPAAWRQLWESTGGDWAANPWVWVVEFKRVQP